MSSLSTIERGIKLQRISQGTYEGTPDPLFFNAANSAHGGYLLAFCVKAAQDHLKDSKPLLCHPLSLHASYLNPVSLTPKSPWKITVTTLKQGRRFAFLDVKIDADGKPGITASALLSGDPPKDPHPLSLTNTFPEIPKPGDCIEALDFAKKHALGIIPRPHTAYLVSPTCTPTGDPAGTGYPAYVGWQGTNFGGYAGAAYWVDGVMSLGSTEAIERLHGIKENGGNSWATLTMTVDFCAPFLERPEGDPFNLKDGTELYVAKEKVVWVSGALENGQICEEVDLWDPSTKRLMCRTKQVALVAWHPKKTPRDERL